jgi:hypothetical protein
LASLGSGYRSKTFASAYNEAALDGKVSHANKGNVLKTKEGESLNAANLDGYVDNQSAVQRNPYQRPTVQRPVNKPTRLNPNNVDRSRVRTSAKPRANSQSASRNSYQRGNSRGTTSSPQHATRPNSNSNRGNISRDIQRSKPNINGYNRGNSNRNDYTRPTSPNTNSRSNGYRSPSRSDTQPSRNATRPLRPSTPSRSTQPSRSSKPSRSVSPNRGGSSSRSSGSSFGSKPSSGSKSRGGRP